MKDTFLNTNKYLITLNKLYTLYSTRDEIKIIIDIQVQKYIIIV